MWRKKNLSILWIIIFCLHILDLLLLQWYFFILYFSCKSFVLKKNTKLKIFLLISFVDLTHYITYIIKFSFSNKLIKKELFPSIAKNEEELKEEEEKSKIIWFYDFDIVIISFLTFYILVFFVYIVVWVLVKSLMIIVIKYIL